MDCSTLEDHNRREISDSMTLRVAVIGGGPAGLVTLKHLLEARNAFPGTTIQPALFEAHDEIGGVFQQQVYEDAELVSSKYLTAFSDFRLPEYEPDFPSAQRYLDYLKDYATSFDLWRYIKSGIRLKSIRPDPDRPGHVLHLEAFGTEATSGPNPGPLHFDVVAICTGLNHAPYMPEITGLKSSPDASQRVQIIHSKDFKSRAQFGQNKTVLVLGAGETAMDIAALAVGAPTKRVIMCHRDGFTYQPKIVPQPFRLGRRSGGPDPRRTNKPLDCSAAALFDTAYVPTIVQSSPFPWAVYDFFVKTMAVAVSGTRAGFDQWVGGIDPARFHADAVMFCKSDRALPYISEQYRSQSFFNKWRTWLLNVPIEQTGGGKIDLAPWPTHFDDEGVVHFQRNDRPESKKMQQEKQIRPDIVVFATGYQRSFPFLPENDARYPTVDEATTRSIYRDIEDGIAYIGFVRPALGAIPPLAELQAQRWIYDLVCSRKYQRFFSKSFRVPLRSINAVDPYELDYKLHSRDAVHDFGKSKLAVDHESYAYQLAVDMGAAPTWVYVWDTFGLEVLFTWAMGPNFTPKFRLVGPWANDAVTKQAVSLMQKNGELGRVVRRTGGGIFFITYTIIPLLIFGPMCIAINILTSLWEAAIACCKTA